MKNKENKNKKSKSESGIFSFFRFIFLAALCVLSSIILVWPLWKFSTGAPKIYTAIVCAIIIAFLIYLIVKKIIKSKISSVIQVFSNIIIIFATLYFFIHFILIEKRLLGVGIFFIGIAALFVLNIIFKKRRHE